MYKKLEVSYLILSGIQNFAFVLCEASIRCLFSFVLKASIITRSREKAVDIWNIDPAQGQWYILETNYDHWEKPFFIDDRRTPANNCMKKLTQKVCINGKRV